MVLLYLAVVYIVFNQPYLTFMSFLTYSLLPVGLMGLCLMIELLKAKEKVTGFISRTGGKLGKYSYSMYVIHYPVLFFFAAFIQNPAVNLLVSVICIALFVYSLETYVQPFVVNYFRKPAESQLPAFSFRAWLKPTFRLVLVNRIILSLITTVVWVLTLHFHSR